jgi:hypothetical protein
MAVALAVVVIGVPALVWTLWPLLRRNEARRAFLPLPPDAREQLGEQKRRVLRTLRELDFEHDAGHISDDDYADLRARYEAEAATILGELDRLGAPRPTEASRWAGGTRSRSARAPSPCSGSGSPSAWVSCATRSRSGSPDRCPDPARSPRWTRRIRRAPVPRRWGRRPGAVRRGR